MFRAPDSCLPTRACVYCRRIWQEAKRLCGGALKIYPYHGSNRKKDPEFLAQFDLVVTTYGVVQVKSLFFFFYLA